jgi:Glycosyltransferase family 87
VASYRGPEDGTGRSADWAVVLEPGAGSTPIGLGPTGHHGVITLERPSRTDPVVRAASAVIGGPAGRRLGAARSGFGPGAGARWVTIVLILMSVVTLGLGVLQKQHCRADGWSTPDQFWHACYSDVAVLYGSAGLGAKNAPTLFDAVGKNGLGQPPLTSAAMWVVSRAVGGQSAAAIRSYFDLSAVVLAGLLAIAVVAVAAAAGRRPWDAAHVALAPMLITVGLLSYDLLAVALLACGLLAWTRRHPMLAGVLFGLAITARPVSAAVLLAVLALSIRTGQVRAAMSVVPAGVSWLVVRLALLPGWTGQIPEAFQTWKSSGPGYGSIWLVPSLISQSRPGTARFWYTGPGLTSSLTTLCALLGLVAVAAVTLVFGLSASDRPRLAQLCLFAVAGSLLVTKSLPVQASLLLLPFVALAGLRWRDHLIWATAELTYFIGVWLYIAASSDPNKGLPAGFYLLLLLIRLAGIGWLLVRTFRMMRDPLTDPVRVPTDGSPGSDDPQGGLLDGAPDALVLRLV